jgi:hypothetical protein
MTLQQLQYVWRNAVAAHKQGDIATARTAIEWLATQRSESVRIDVTREQAEMIQRALLAYGSSSR